MSEPSATVEPSGYHSPLCAMHERIVGCWILEWGQLPDGRWGLDYHNTGQNQRTRHYFKTEADARAEAMKF